MGREKMYEVEKVKTVRRRLHDLIAKKCLGLNVNFTPQIGDQKIDRLTGRVLDISSIDRLLFVDLNNDQNSFVFDGFIKTTGIDYEFELLQVSFDPDKLPIEVIWDLYHQWIIVRKSRQKMEPLITNLFEKYKHHS